MGIVALIWLLGSLCWYSLCWHAGPIETSYQSNLWY